MQINKLTGYILKRLLLIVPTLLGIMLLNFLIVQIAPGGPIEQVLAEISGLNTTAEMRLASAASSEYSSGYRGAQGIDPDFIKDLEKQFGFDKPLHERFWLMLKSYVQFDFGESFYRNEKVIDLVLDKMPVSISLGLWTTLIVYLISIPLGIRKAIQDGSVFDVWSSIVIVVAYAIPAFLFAVLLIVLFAGGSYFSWFPLRGLVSDDFSLLSWPMQIADYFWHITLPILALVMGGFASLTMLTKNSFLDEIHKQYVLTARAKGLVESQVLYGHVFRNAMLIVIAGFPQIFISTLFSGALMIEVIFSLDGMGLLGFEAAFSRDYPVMFGTLFIFTLLGLVLNLISDLMYVWVDPRIDFHALEHR